MYNIGYVTAQVAPYIGLFRFMSRVKKQKVTRTRVTEQEVTDIVTMWKAGYARKKIAASLSKSENTVRDVIRRLQKAGVIEKRVDREKPSDEALQNVADECGLSIDVILYLLPLAKARGAAETITKLRSLTALWASQKGRCYYTGAALGTKGPTKATLVDTSWVGRVFVTDIASTFRGKLSHRSFLRMVQVIGQNLFGIS